MAGQMSLFDLVGEEEKKDFEIRLPDVGEYEKEQMLAFEKEVLGVYISGHPLEEFEAQWRKSVTAVTTDFETDDELGTSRVSDGQVVIVGGMITAKTVKTTKNNQMMAFITLEDLLGTVEIIVFPRDYEKYRPLLCEDAKIYVRGRVSASEDQQAKLICEKIVAFSDIPREVWIRFDDKKQFEQMEQRLYDCIEDEDGGDYIVVFCQKEKMIRRLPIIYNIQANHEIIGRLSREFGAENIKIKQNTLKMS